MAKITHKQRVDLLLEHIQELENYYTTLGIRNENMLYLRLTQSELFLKAVNMQIVLIGENCKALQLILEKKQLRGTPIHHACDTVRKFRNVLVHNYYSLETEELFEKLLIIRTVLKVEVTNYNIKI